MPETHENPLEPLPSKREWAREFLIKEDREDVRGVREEDVRIKSALWDIVLRVVFSIGLLGIFLFAVVYSLWIVRCVGYGVMHLNDNVLLALIGATVAEIAVILVLAAKYLFQTASKYTPD